MQAMSLVFWDRNLVLIEQRLEWIFSWGRGKGKNIEQRKKHYLGLGEGKLESEQWKKREPLQEGKEFYQNFLSIVVTCGRE